MAGSEARSLATTVGRMRWIEKHTTGFPLEESGYPTHTVGKLVGGRIYVFGVFHSPVTSERLFGECIFYYFDVKKLRWIGTQVRGPNLEMAAVVLVDDCLYMFGGSVFQEPEVSPDFWLFDIPLGQFRVLRTYGASHQYDTESATAEFLQRKNQIVVFGGFHSYDGRENKLRVYHVGINKWISVETKGSTPSGRYLHASCVHNDVIYISGGRCRYDDEGAIHTLQYVGEHMLWTKPVVSGNIPQYRYGHTMTVLFGKVFVFGGQEVYGATADCYVYDPITNIWLKHFSSPHSNFYHMAIAVKDELFCFGGTGRRVEAFDSLARWQ